jgi:hypothetical protein
VVSVSFSPHVERSDRLQQSVDLAIRDLLGDGVDPLAKAAYLWTMRRHDKPLVNSDALVRWGFDWVRQILVEGETSRRRDEEVSSAALAAAALAGTKAFSSIREGVRAGLKAALDEELGRNRVPFRRPSYGAALLYGAHSLSVEAAGLREAILRTGESFRDSVPGGRLFGLPFVVRMLRDLKEENLAREMGQAVQDALADPKTSYEDQPYLVQALWESCGGVPDEAAMATAERVLAKSPAWGYLMNGAEDVPPAGDGRAVVFVSHLFRASLLDVLMSYQSAAAEHKEAQLDARYRVRAGISWSAFSFYVLILVIAWTGLMIPLVKHAGGAYRYWLLSDYSAMPKSWAVLYLLLGVNLFIYLSILTVMILPTLYRVFIKAQIGSDERIKKILGARLWASTKIWLGLMAVELVLGVLVELIIPSIQHTIGRSESNK